MIQLKIDKARCVSCGNCEAWLLGLTKCVRLGGYESAQKIKGKADMLEFAGQIEGEIFNVDDAYHAMPLADMVGVAYAIAIAYETALTNYKIKSTAVNLAATAEEIAAVVW